MTLVRLFGIRGAFHVYASYMLLSAQPMPLFSIRPQDPKAKPQSQVVGYQLGA